MSLRARFDRDLTLGTVWHTLSSVGAKLNVIRDLGFTSTAYYQRLSRLLDDPDAAVLAPVLKLERYPAALPR